MNASGALPLAAESQTDKTCRALANNAYLLCALFVLLLVPAFQADLPVAHWFAQHKTPGSIHKLLAFCEVCAHGIGVGLILLAVLVLDAKRWRAVPRMAACAYGAGMLVNLVKLSVGRVRPNASSLEGSVLDTFVGVFPILTRPEGLDRAVQSFPSGHTATAVGLAIALAFRYRQGRWLFATLAALAALQRIDAGAHYASDVLAGAAVGALWAGLCVDPALLGWRFDRIEQATDD